MLSIRDIRKSTGLSQKEFARQYHIPASTLQKWEQGIMSPAPYVIALLTDVIPETRKGLDQIKYKNETYYIDTASHTVSDSAGNMVRYDADIEAVKKNNLGLYLHDMFRDLHECKERFERDCYYDTKEDIIWTEDGG